MENLHSAEDSKVARGESRAEWGIKSLKLIIIQENIIRAIMITVTNKYH